MHTYCACQTFHQASGRQLEAMISTVAAIRQSLGAHVQRANLYRILAALSALEVE
ncbi:MAG: hypothetical protein ACI9SB_001701 [Candidatus Azotimanducaceae bacterium]